MTQPPNTVTPPGAGVPPSVTPPSAGVPPSVAPPPPITPTEPPMVAPPPEPAPSEEFGPGDRLLDPDQRVCGGRSLGETIERALVRFPQLREGPLTDVLPPGEPGIVAILGNLTQPLGLVFQVVEARWSSYHYVAFDEFCVAELSGVFELVFTQDNCWEVAAGAPAWGVPAELEMCDEPRPDIEAPFTGSFETDCGEEIDSGKYKGLVKVTWSKDEGTVTFFETPNPRLNGRPLPAPNAGWPITAELIESQEVDGCTQTREVFATLEAVPSTVRVSETIQKACPDEPTETCKWETFGESATPLGD